MKINNTIDIYCVRLDASPSGYERYRQLLNHEEKARADRFRFDPDRVRWTSSRAALRLILGKHLNLYAGDVCFRIRPDGKPEVCPSSTRMGNGLSEPAKEAVAPPPIEFNLSHSRDFGVIAVSKRLPVGSDVEYMGRMNDWRSVSRRVFSEAEQDELAGIDSEIQPRAFYLGWTRKEAVIKTTGEGLRADLKSFDVTLTPDREARVIDDRRQADCLTPWQLHHLDIDDDYVGAIATVSSQPVRFRMKTFQSAFSSASDSIQLHTYDD